MSFLAAACTCEYRTGTSGEDIEWCMALHLPNKCVFASHHACKTKFNIEWNLHHGSLIFFLAFLFAAQTKPCSSFSILLPALSVCKRSCTGLLELNQPTYKPPYSKQKATNGYKRSKGKIFMILLWRCFWETEIDFTRKQINLHKKFFWVCCRKMELLKKNVHRLSTSSTPTSGLWEGAPPDWWQKWLRYLPPLHGW